MGAVAGYVGRKNAESVLLSMFDRLRRFGGESSGIAVLEKKQLEVRKTVGFLKGPLGLKGNIGIGHLRWALKGRPSKRNAHPFTSCDGEWAIVHSGFLLNTEELVRGLPGHAFSSDTDSEVIAHLLEGRKGIRAFREVLGQLRGSWALLALNRREKRVYFAKKGLPLFIGVGRREFFLASDPVAFLPWTKEVVVPEEGAYGWVEPASLKVYGGFSKRRVHWEPGDLALRGFATYAEKELHEVPEVLFSALKVDVSPILKVLEEEEVDLVASPPYFPVAIYFSYLLSLAGVKARAIHSEEYPLLSKGGRPGILFGDPSLPSSVRVAEDFSAPTVPLGCGPEVSATPTKSVIASFLIAAKAFAEFSGDEHFKEELFDLQGPFKEVLRKNLGSKRLRRFAEKGLVVAGIGWGMPAVFSTSFSLAKAAGLPAFPLRLTEASTYSRVFGKGIEILAFLPSGPFYDEAEISLERLRAQGTKTTVVSDLEGDLEMPTVDERLVAPLYAFLGQKISLALASYLRRDPDVPSQGGLLVDL